MHCTVHSSCPRPILDTAKKSQNRSGMRIRITKGSGPIGPDHVKKNKTRITSDAHWHHQCIWPAASPITLHRTVVYDVSVRALYHTTKLSSIVEIKLIVIS